MLHCSGSQNNGRVSNLFYKTAKLWSLNWVLKLESQIQVWSISFTIIYWNLLSFQLKKKKIWTIPKENRDEFPCHRREQEPKSATHWVPQLTRALTTEKADCSLFSHRQKDHLAAALAQGPSSSSLTCILIENSREYAKSVFFNFM